MKLHLPSLLRAALLACFAIPSTLYADTYTVEGINVGDITSSDRFYDGGKGYYWTWSVAPNAFKKYGDYEWLGELYNRVPIEYHGTQSEFNDDAFRNLEDDANTCWAYTSANIVQYWQSYYGVFYRGTEELPYGLTYDKKDLVLTGGTQSLEVNMAFYDSFANDGDNLATALQWYMGGIAEPQWTTMRPGYLPAGYFAEYWGNSTQWWDYAEYRDVYSDTTAKEFASYVADALGYVASASNTYELSIRGQISYLGLTATDDGAGHAITCYGFETDANGNIVSVQVTNSDDRKYELFTLYVKKGDVGFLLYTDAACTELWVYSSTNWYVDSIASIITPEPLQKMYAEYTSAETPLVWTGTSSEWGGAADTFTTDELPTASTGWTVYVDDGGSEFAGDYATYFADGRKVEFGDIGGSISLARDIRVSSMSVANDTADYAFSGNGWKLTSESLSKTGAGGLSFDAVELHINTVELSGGRTELGANTSLVGSTVTVNSGAGLVFNGANAELTSITVNSGASLAFSATTTLTADALSCMDGSVLTLSVFAGGPTVDMGSGSLTIDGSLELLVNATLTSSSYTLISAGSITVQDITNYTVSGSGYSTSSQYIWLTLNDTATSLILNLSNGENLEWSGGDGDWSLTSPSWSVKNGPTGCAYTNGANVTFANDASATIAITEAVDAMHMTITSGHYDFVGVGYLSIDNNLVLQSAEVSFDAAPQFGSASVISIADEGSSLTISEGDVSVKNFSNKGSVTLGKGGLTVASAVASGGTVSASSVTLAAASTNSFTKLTTGAVTYAGEAGSLSVGDGSQLGSLSGGSLEVTAGSVSIGSSTALSALSNAGSLAVSGSLSVASEVAAGGSVSAYDVTLAGASTNSFTKLTAGAVTYAGEVGSLSVGDGSQLGSLSGGSLEVVDGSVAITSTETTSLSVLSGAGSLTLDNGLVLAEASTLGGDLSVAGALSLGSTLTVGGNLSAASIHLAQLGDLQAGGLTGTSVDFSLSAAASDYLQELSLISGESCAIASLTNGAAGVTLSIAGSSTMQLGMYNYTISEDVVTHDIILTAALANVIEWSSLDGTWDTTEDWNGLLPGEGDTLALLGGGTADVHVTNDRDINGLVVEHQNTEAYRLTGAALAMNTLAVSRGALELANEGGTVVRGNVVVGKGSSLLVAEESSFEAVDLHVTEEQGFANHGTTTLSGVLSAENTTIVNTGTLAVGSGKSAIGALVAGANGSAGSFYVADGAEVSIQGDSSVGYLSNAGSISMAGYDLELGATTQAGGRLTVDTLSLATGANAFDTLVAGDVKGNTAELALGDGSNITGTLSGSGSLSVQGTVAIADVDGMVNALTVAQGGQLGIASTEPLTISGELDNQGSLEVGGNVVLQSATRAGGNLSAANLGLAEGVNTFGKLVASTVYGNTASLELGDGSHISTSLSGGGSLSIEGAVHIQAIESPVAQLQIAQSGSLSTASSLVVDGIFSSRGSLNAAGCTVSFTSPVVAGGNVTAGTLVLSGSGNSFDSLTVSALTFTGSIVNGGTLLNAQHLAAASNTGIHIDIASAEGESGSYQLLRADSGLSSIAFTLSPDVFAAYLERDVTATLATMDGALYLNLSSRDPQYYEHHSATANGMAAASLIDRARRILSPAADTDLGKLMQSLEDTINNGGTAEMVDTITAAAGGASIPALGLAFAGDVSRQLRAIRNRTTVMGVDSRYEHPDMPYVNAWINAEGDYREMEEDGTASGFTLSSWGGTVGVDVDVAENLTLGFACSALYGDFSATGVDDAEGDMDTYYASFFARIPVRRWVHTFVMTAGMADVSLERTVHHGVGSYRTEGSTDGLALGALYEVAYTISLSEDDTVCWQPVANVSIVHTTIDAYEEEGADAALCAGEQEFTQLSIGLGARLQAVVGEKLYNRTSILELRALAKADLGDREGEADIAFAALPGQTATLRSNDYGAVGVELGAGLTIPVSADSGELFFDVSAELRSGQSEVNGAAGWRVHF